MKAWEADTGRLANTFREHRGWVTDFLFWADTKLMLSSANDGVLVAWGSGGGVSDRIMILQPVYCMAINPRRHQLICGVSCGIRVYCLDNEKECGHYVNNKCLYIAGEHEDIVRCIVCHESRVYSAGYDQKLIIYDSSYTGDNSMKPFKEIKQAHDAGISCLVLVKDNENNLWIITGSFDKTVKVWSPDGKPACVMRGFLSTVSGVCYIPRCKTIWATGGYSYAIMYDPKSGENVSKFIGTFQTKEDEQYQLNLLKYFPELNQVVGSTSRRHLMVWKYNSSGCVTALQSENQKPFESLAYTRKVPILIFSGDSEGMITKWERKQSNHFAYNNEFLPLSDAKKGKKKKKREREKEEKKQEEQKLRERNNKNRICSHYPYNKPILTEADKVQPHPNTTILKILFVESLDLIVAACEDSHIYVWGFDEDAAKAWKTMKQPDEEKNKVKKYSVLLTHSDLLLDSKSQQEEDSVTNRVAGFMCKHILAEHTNCVTSLAIVEKTQDSKNTYLLSAGWDRRICVWNLEEGALEDIFRNPSLTRELEHVELACDGDITDLAYCPNRKEFAYASSDKMVYLRRFSTTGVHMVLLNTLQGHYCEVTCIKWNAVRKKWISGSEDGTIRIWSSEGLNECEQVLSAMGSITAMCIDNTNGAIIAGVQEVIRVFESEQYRLVQTNVGHTDAVRSIIHMPERNQYVSSSWDQTIRIWNAWKMPKKKRRVSKDKRESGVLRFEDTRKDKAENSREKGDYTDADQGGEADEQEDNTYEKGYEEQ